MYVAFPLCEAVNEHDPAAKMVTVVPESEQVPAPVVSAKLTVSPDEAVAERLKVGSPYVLAASAPKVMLCPEVTRKLTVTESEAKKFGELPDWLATTVQVPTVFNERVEPEVMSQTEVVLDV